VVAANREYVTLRDKAAGLPVEWKGLLNEAERRIDADYGRRREELAR